MRLGRYCLFMKGMFENKVLRSIQGSEEERISVRWRKLRSEELYNLCALPNIILSTPSFGREVKSWSHVVDLRHVKDP